MVKLHKGSISICFMALIVFGNWNNSLFSGPRCRNLNNVRANSNNNVGGRDYNKPQDF